MLQNVGEGGWGDGLSPCLQKSGGEGGGIDPFAPLVQLVTMVLERVVVFVYTKDR